MLRQPMENEKVTISRVHSTVTYPAKFIFIAAMNPCPCGYWGSSDHYCTCSEKQIRSYKSRVSGPILDRIDILLSLNPVNLKEHNFNGIESSEEVKKRVIAARERQYARYGKEVCNGSVSFEQLTSSSPLTPLQQQNLQSLSSAQGFSNRVQIKIIRLARTIADLKGDDIISDEAIEEALLLRKISLRSIQTFHKKSLTGEKHNVHYQ